MRALRTIAATAAALLCARAALSQPKPAVDDADVEIPVAPASPQPTPSVSPSQSPSSSPAPSPASPPSPTVVPAQQPKAAASETGPAPLPINTGIAGPEAESLQRELADLRERIHALETAPPPAKESALESALPRDYAISAYVQSQYEHHQDSQDQVAPGGVYLNQNRFLVRHGRVRFDAAWRFAEIAIVLDANTTRSATVGVSRAEASLVYRGSGPWLGIAERRAPPRDEEPPLVKVSFGLTEIPFGFELVDSPRERVFMERSLGSLAFFPGDPDLGVRVSGGIGPFRYNVAVMNGQPIDDRPGGTAGMDPNSSKDLVARLGFDAKPAPSLRVAGGVSILRGEGFHQGTDATKNTLQWIDTNENAQVDPGEITGLPGAAATPSVNFSRWGYGVDLRARLKTALGETMVYGELTLGQNLDRGLYVADPVVTGIDTRELAYYVAVVQDVTPYGVIGIRYDLYDPNADFFDKRGGQLIPKSEAIRTISPLAGLVLPGRARLVFQYDAVHDLLARDARGVPIDLKNDRWTLRLQVQL